MSFGKAQVLMGGGGAAPGWRQVMTDVGASLRAMCEVCDLGLLVESSRPQFACAFEATVVGCWRSGAQHRCSLYSVLYRSKRARWSLWTRTNG